MSTVSFFPYLVSLSFFYPHPLNRVSFSHLRTSDRVFFVSALVQRVDGRSFCGRAFQSSFPNSSPFSCASMVVRFDFRVGGEAQSCVLPKECCAFFPKTTASWLSHVSLIKFLGTCLFGQAFGCCGPPPKSWSKYFICLKRRTKM